MDFARVEGKLREIASRPEPLGTFVAFLPGDVAARDEVESRLDLRALEHRDAEARPDRPPRARAEARAASASAAVRSRRSRRRRGAATSGTCRVGPFEYVAYDADGKVLGRRREPLVAAAVRPPAAFNPEGPEEPGDKRGRRPTMSDSSVTLSMMSGRSPDGALYEFFIDKSKYGDCMSIWWPYARGESWGRAAVTGCRRPPPSGAVTPRRCSRSPSGS